MTANLNLNIELGALTEVPVWEDHKRGKNWCASIEKDHASPGGLNRTFWTKARGDYFYMVPQSIKPGTPIEFGADYYTGSGRPQRDRWYGYVMHVNDKQLVLCRCATAAGAINEGKMFAEENKQPEDPFLAWWEAHVATNEISRAGSYTFDYLRTTAEAAWRANERKKT